MKSLVLVLLFFALGLPISHAQLTPFNANDSRQVVSGRPALDISGAVNNVVAYYDTPKEGVAGAEWTWQNPLPTGNRLFNVALVSSTVGWAVGEQGTILKTKDGGITWSVQSSGTTNDLMGVSFSDADHGTVVGGRNEWNGSASLILRTNNGGESWTQQPCNSFQQLNAVAFTDQHIGTAVGRDGTILRTTDGGESWTEQNSGVSAHLYSVSFVDSLHGTVVGNEGTILQTTDGGATWSLQSVETTSNLRCVSFADPQNGLAVGENGTILRTFDGGATWIRQNSGTALPLYGAKLINKNTGIIVGTISIVLTTTNGGTDWVMQTAKQNMLYGVSFIDVNTGIAVGGDKSQGQGAIILKSTNGGKSWTEKTRAVTGQYLKDVCFADKNNGIAVGTSGTIVSTANGGSTWTAQYSGTVADLEDVQYIDSTNWMALGARGASMGEKLWTGVILSSTNGGKTWVTRSLQPSDKAYNFTNVHFFDAMNGILVGGEYDSPEYVPGLDYNPLVLTTSNGGKDWVRRECEGVGRLESVSFADRNNGFAVGQLPMNGGQYYYGLILRTTDGGQTWALQPNDIQHGLVKVYFKDAKNGFILTDHYNIVRTTDGGNSWFEQNVESTSFKSDIFFTDSIHGTIVCSPDILKTADGGETWEKQPVGTKNNLTAAYFFDASNGIIVGQGGTILKTSSAPCLLPLAAGKITGDEAVCEAEAMKIYSVDSIAGAASYAWSYSGTGVSIVNGKTNKIYIVYLDNATPGTLSVRGVNACGEGPVATMAISINPVPAAAGEIKGATVVNSGQKLVTYSVVPMDHATSYRWTLPEGATGESTTHTITVDFGTSAVSGNITVKGINPCNEGEESVLGITVNNAPVAMAGKNLAVNEGNVISLDGSASKDPDGDALTYKWIAPKGFSLDLPFAAHPTFTAPEIKTDSVVVFMLIVNDGVLDSDPSYVVVTLKNSIRVDIPDLSENELKVYPNPVTDELWIEGKAGNIPYEIVNALGEVVCKGILTGKTSIATGNFKPGMYVVKIGEGSSAKMRKIVKE